MIANNVFMIYCIILLILALYKEAYLGVMVFASLIIFTIVVTRKECKDIIDEEKENE